MKKLFFILALMLTTVSFANETKSELVVDSSKSTKILEINTPISKDDVGCAYTTTTIFYRAVFTRVLSMNLDEVAYEVTVVVDSICTTCYYFNLSGGVSSSTICD